MRAGPATAVAMVAALVGTIALASATVAPTAAPALAGAGASAGAPKPDGIPTAVDGADRAPPMYRDGPPPGHTGGFGEPLCSECHFGAPVNADPGTLTYEMPAFVEADEVYSLVVELNHPEMVSAGFQLAVRFTDGDRAGEQAGTLRSREPRTAVAVDTATGVQYGHHTAAGTALSGAGEARWTLEWTAPDTAADVMVHVAANAANDDASEFGDHIYSAATRLRASRQTRPGASAACRDTPHPDQVAAGPE